MPGFLFDDRHLDALSSAGTIRAYPKHTLLIQEGDQNDQIYVVLSGRLKVFLSDSDGKEIVIDTLGPRQLFGEMALEGEPRSASVMTTEVCKLVMIQRDQFKQFLAANPEAAYSLIRKRAKSGSRKKVCKSSNSGVTNIGKHPSTSL